MPLLDSAAHVVPDPWTRLDDAPASGSVIVALTRLLAEPAWRDYPSPLGVELPIAADLAQIVPWLGRLALVVVPFPGFRDGRGFTVARTLRERHRFVGEIRASGHVLPDQYAALLRVGFATVELPDGSDISEWSEALRLSSAGLPWIRRVTLPFETV